MAFTIIENAAGYMPIANTDPGAATANTATLVPSQPMYLGMIVKATDPTYGLGEFILLKGVASTVVGSLVRYNSVSFQTVLAVNTAVQAMPVAVAMSVCDASAPALYGWYQISGTAALAKTAVIILPNVAVYISGTAGKVKALASAGLQVVACRSQLVTTASASSTVLVTINRPHLQSQIT